MLENKPSTNVQNQKEKVSLNKIFLLISLLKIIFEFVKFERWIISGRYKGFYIWSASKGCCNCFYVCVQTHIHRHSLSLSPSLPPYVCIRRVLSFTLKWLWKFEALILATAGFSHKRSSSCNLLRKYFFFKFRPSSGFYVFA